MKSSLLLIMALLLSACGYHLRGALQLPEAMKTIYVSGASAELATAIAETFRSASGELVASSADAGVILNVIKEDYQRRTISLSSTGYSNEYELVYRLTFDLLDKNGDELASKQTIESSKTYYNEQSSETLISKDNEEAMLREELYTQAVRAVVERARAALKKSML